MARAAGVRRWSVHLALFCAAPSRMNTCVRAFPLCRCWACTKTLPRALPRPPLPVLLSCSLTITADHGALLCPPTLQLALDCARGLAYLHSRSPQVCTSEPAGPAATLHHSAPPSCSLRGAWVQMERLPSNHTHKLQLLGPFPHPAPQPSCTPLPPSSSPLKAAQGLPLPSCRHLKLCRQSSTGT